MKKKYRELVKALEPFISENMERHLIDWSDEATVRLAVNVTDGYVLSRTLGQLRALWKAYKEVVK